LQQTGMSFGRWRQQFHIMLALERLAGGEAVHTVAIDLGYDGASPFVTMFDTKGIEPHLVRSPAPRRRQTGAPLLWLPTLARCRHRRSSPRSR